MLSCARKYCTLFSMLARLRAYNDDSAASCTGVITMTIVARTTNEVQERTVTAAH